MRELIFQRSFVPATKHYKNSVAVIDGAYRATFHEHGARVFRLAHALKHQLGLKPNSRFAVLARNSHAYLELYHAALLGAGVINPLNLRLSAKELDYIIRDSGAEVVFVDRHFQPLLDAAMHIGDASPRQKTILIGDGDGAYDLRYEDLIAGAEPATPVEPNEEDVAVLMYTGGTTGLPKGVVLSQRAMALNLYHARISRPMLDDSIVSLVQTPMFHVTSLTSLLLTHAVGGTLVLIPGFDPKLVIDEIERNQVTSTTMVPTMIGMMISHPSFSPERVSTLKNLSYGASPMSTALLAKLLDVMPEINLSQGYGMTEAAGIVTNLSPSDHRRGGALPSSVGRAVMGVEVAILDEHGRELGPREVGEVCAKGGNFMTEYWNKSQATEEAFRDGWYHTGDAGYVDEEGYLFLVDRVKDMIISGAENIYCIEVENAIGTHPAVAQVAVIGIPHETWGEAVHAIVVLRDGAEATAEALIAHAREQIAGYKVPRSIEFRSEPLPLSGAMKVLKRELRAPYWQGRNAAIS